MVAVMKLDNLELIAVPNPHTEELNGEGLQHKIDACVAAGEDSSFYVGVQQRMKAFESNLAATPEASPAKPGANWTPKAPGT